MISKVVKKNLVALVLLAGILSPFSLALAQTCPSVTTVEGTTVNFSGELADMGGDSITYVWFEYGQTTSLGQKTSEQARTQTGLYCIRVFGLNPNTTYYYRAAARNSADTSFGEIKSFTTRAATTSALTTTLTAAGDFTVRKTVRNVSRGTDFIDSLVANPGETLIFGIGIRVGANPVTNLVVSDVLPTGIIYRGDLRVDNVLSSGNIFTGLNLGNLSANQEVRITFRGDVAGPASFAFGQTELTNSASALSGAVSATDTARIIVTRAEVAGAATEVVTGLTDNIFLDSFLLPLVIALLIVWLFKARIIRFEEWLDSRKKEYQIYKSKKILKIKVAKTKAKEFLQRLA